MLAYAWGKHIHKLVDPFLVYFFLFFHMFFYFFLTFAFLIKKKIILTSEPEALQTACEAPIMIRYKVCIVSSTQELVWI